MSTINVSLWMLEAARHVFMFESFLFDKYLVRFYFFAEPCDIILPLTIVRTKFTEICFLLGSRDICLPLQTPAF